MMTRNAPRRAVPPIKPDRSWEARAAALRQEKPANLAMVGAVLAVLAAFVAWVAVLAPPHGSARGSPVFWLLAVPLLCWTTPLLGFRAWAVNTVWLALALAPLLSLAALLTARHLREAHLLTPDPALLDTPAAMLVILGVTVLFSVAGAVALRRSSLPGGTRPASYLAPGTLPPGRYPVPAAVIRALMVGSLTLSGTAVNGIFFGILALLNLGAGPSDPILGSLWPAAIPLLLIGATAFLVIRGSRRLSRRAAGAEQSLRWGWRIGAGSTCLLLVLALIWPLPTSLKLGMGLFMAPMAVAAVWGASSALRRLRAAGAGMVAARIVLVLGIGGALGGAEAVARDRASGALAGSLPGAVRDVSITANGARSDDVSGEESAALCSRFRLDVRDVREFLAIARNVDQRAYAHDLEMSRCHAAGRVTFAGGARGRWRIDMQRRGLVILADGRRLYLYCAGCTSRRYDAVYDPERDG